MAKAVELIVGLGNPGAEYDQTRHNAGFWFIDELARQHGGSCVPDKKFHGDVGKINIKGQTIWLLKPMTFMNRSGQGVVALAKYYKIEPQAILVAHDELDFQAGVVKLKENGGHGGHNGLRDIIQKLGGVKDFQRLRIGIDRPKVGGDVADYVLGRPSIADRDNIGRAIDSAVDIVPILVEGDFQRAAHRLHT